MIKYSINLQKLGFYFALFLICCLLNMGKSYAQTTAGNATFNFLSLPYSPKASSLGGINISSLNPDLGLSMSNPSLLNEQMDGQLYIGSKSYFAGIQQYDLLGVNHWEEKNITTGWGIHYLDYGNIPMTDIAGNELGTMHPNDYAVQFSAAAHYIENFRIGGTIKFIQSNYGIYKSNGLGMDVGLTYKAPNNLSQASLLITNMGVQMSTTGAKQEIPFNIILGWTKRLTNAPLQFSITADRLSVWNRSYFDANYENVYGASPSSSLQNLYNHLILGTEIFMGENVDFNLGYNFIRRYDLNIYNQANSLNGFSSGVGIKLDRIALQYANSFFQSNTYHHFSLAYHFKK
jgi:hypothetical protein